MTDLLPDVDPAELTDDQRAELIRYALSDTGGPVTRWIIAYEQATGDGFSIASRGTEDPY